MDLLRIDEAQAVPPPNPEDFIGRVHGLVDRNRIFIDRTRDVGVLTTAEAIDYGFTGPLLRSTGAPRDLRQFRTRSVARP